MWGPQQKFISELQQSAGKLTLSLAVCTNNGVKHFIINQDSEGQFYIEKIRVCVSKMFAKRNGFAIRIKFRNSFSLEGRFFTGIFHIKEFKFYKTSLESNFESEDFLKLYYFNEIFINFEIQRYGYS